MNNTIFQILKIDNNKSITNKKIKKILISNNSNNNKNIGILVKRGPMPYFYNNAIDSIGVNSNMNTKQDENFAHSKFQSFPN